MTAEIPGFGFLPSESNGAGRMIGNFHVPHQDLHGRCRPIHSFEGLSKLKEECFGVFYKATDVKNRKCVTLKSYNLSENLQNETFTTVMNEVNTLYGMEHRNIVKMLEVISGESLDSIWIVFEDCPHSLTDLLQNPSFLFPHVVKKVMEEIFCGLKYLHSADYCHGNLNPENILFHSSGVLKIADYTNPDIYHDTTSLDGNDITVTDPVLMGSLAYCVLNYKPLEILLGSKKQHPAIDMWAVGCIFAELLLKKKLFVGTTIKAVCEDIINLLGLPNDDRLPGISELFQQCNVTANDCNKYMLLQRKLRDQRTTCVHLLAGLLVYNPKVRLTAEECLTHEYFTDPEGPKACSNEAIACLLGCMKEGGSV